MANEPAQPPETDVVGYLLRQGAISRKTAVRLGDLSSLAPATLRALLMSGVVREAAPGVYYLAEWPDTGLPRTPAQIVKTLAFWLLILGIPVVLIQFTR
jgi:hypothetical protein